MPLPDRTLRRRQMMVLTLLPRARPRPQFQSLAGQDAVQVSPNRPEKGCHDEWT